VATRFSDLLILLSGGINQRRLYFDDHPRVRDLGANFTAKLRERLEEKEETAFFFGILNGKFIREGKYLIGPSIAGRNLIEFAGKLKCGGFRIREEVRPEEIGAFFRIAAELKDQVSDLEDAKALFRREDVENIDLSPHYREGENAATADQLARIDPGLIEFDYSDFDGPGGRGGGMGQSVALELAPLLPIFQTMFETVQTNNVHVALSDNLDIDMAREAGTQLMQASNAQTMDIMNLMRYPDYDSYTIGHSVRVSTLAMTVGREMGWPDDQMAELATAALLHDVGKAKVPDEILYKPGKLTDDERKIAESHAAIGAQILLAKGDASPTVVAAAWGHHIRHDKGGYPYPPDWVIKSPIAGLMQVCDVFEALTAARPYKSPMPPRRAFEIILKDPAAYDPVPLTALIRAIGLYPPGSEIALTDGSRGYVMAKGPEWEQPIVRVCRTPGGDMLDPDDQYVVELHQEEDLDVSDFLMVGLDPNEASAQLENMDEEERAERDRLDAEEIEEILHENRT
jgi:putative nucleotidyltransferase with HDIG domain